MSSFKMRDSRIGPQGQKETQMSTTEYNAHDQRVVAELKKLGSGTIAEEYFARAIELGATPALLKGVAYNYLAHSEDGFTVIGLPYVDVLVEAGWRGEQIRPMLEELCFDESSDLAGYHRDGFLRSKTVHSIFDGDAYTAFMKKMAATYEGARFIMTEFGNEVLTERLSWMRSERNQVQRDIREIEAVAAGRLSFIEDEYQLNQMVRYASSGRHDRETAKKQAARAGNVANHGWNLVFRGYVLAKLSRNNEGYLWLIGNVYEMFRIRPNWAVSTYRWLLEGFYRANNEFWHFRVEHSGLKEIFESHGWVFAPVQKVGDRLQVAVTFKGQRATIKHVPGDETLEAGDEVIVSAEQLKGLTPRHQPGGKVYELTLTPARRPTPDQLANHKDYFPSKR